MEEVEEARVAKLAADKVAAAEADARLRLAVFVAEHGADLVNACKSMGDHAQRMAACASAMVSQDESFAVTVDMFTRASEHWQWMAGYLDILAVKLPRPS